MNISSPRKIIRNLCLLLGLISYSSVTQAVECVQPRKPPEVTVQFPAEERTRAGDPVEVRWSSVRRNENDCRLPLYLVFTTTARVRFEGNGFLAMPPGGLGPYEIAEKRELTRVFIPLHALPESASGSFKVKFYGAGDQTFSWFVSQVSADFADPKKRSSTVLTAAKTPIKIGVETGKPAIVVRDSFAPEISTADARVERPKKKITSNSNEFELQIFDKFYRVFEIATGELVLERAGINPNFSPSSRFLGAYADGTGFEVIDLYADATVVTSGALNRRGGYEGTADLAAWSRNDSVLALSFLGWGGVYVQQALVDGSGAGEGMTSCHACNGLGTTLAINFEAGLVTWAGQSKGWGSLLGLPESSVKAEAETKKTIPDNEKDDTVFDRQQTLKDKLSKQFLTQLGKHYLFDGEALSKKLGEATEISDGDGRTWDLGDQLQFSHVCANVATDDCSPKPEEDSAEEKVKRGILATHRVVHRDIARNTNSRIQTADARLIVSRARSARRTASQIRNIWSRLAQLGAPIDAAGIVDVKIESFDGAFENPTRVMNRVSSQLPGMRDIFAPKNDGLEVPDYTDEEHEVKKIDPKRVTAGAHWSIGQKAYWLIHQNYQIGNSSTPNTQYLHLVAGSGARLTDVIDLSTRLSVADTLVKGTDQTTLVLHPWPSDFDIVAIAAGRYLLASGHWLHDADRWGLVYDLKDDKTLFFNGNLPNATTTKSLALTENGKLFAVANSNGYVYFYNIATGKMVLTAHDVDDELVIYDTSGYYVSTYEGSQFVFLKFPGLAGYLSFKQFANVLRKPEIIKSIFDGGEPPTAPDILPPPRLALNARADEGKPGALHLSISAVSPSRDLSKLRLFLDGQFWKERDVRGRAAQIDESIVVPEQTRWLTAIAVDASGSESVPVASPIPQDSRPSNRKLYLLTVGTNAYAKAGRDMQLHYAVADAKSFAAGVQAQNSGYYKSVEAMPFLDAPDLKTKLPKALGAIAKSAASDDTIMLFVSGHGYRAPDNKLYLITRETIPSAIEETSLPWEDLARSFAGAKARIVIFIDACHSGAIPDGGSNDEIVDTLAAQSIRFTVVAAAKGRQESFERKELGGGVFTTTIVKAITSNRAAVDSNNNGVIELSELYSRIKPAILSEMKGVQTPWLARTDTVGEVPLF